MTPGVLSAATDPVPVFRAETADQAWLAVLGAFSEGGPAARQDSRDGPTRELVHAVISIRDPLQRWVHSRRPPLNPAFAIAEALWILWGRNDAALPVFFNSQFPKFNGPGPTYDGAYGERLRRAFGVDQLERGAAALTANPDSRQVVLQIWNGADDLPTAEGSPRRADIPCNVVALLKVRENRLHWTQILRSNDVTLGLPYNIVQFTMMQEVIAGWLGKEVGPYTHLSDSLHVYERNLDDVRESIAKPASPNTDTIGMTLAQTADAWRVLERAVQILITDDTNPARLQSVTDTTELPIGYGNLLAIMAAESARRRGWLGLAAECAAKCDNPALAGLWASWIGHWRQNKNGKGTE